MPIRNTAICPGPIVYVNGGTFLTCQFHETCHGGHRRSVFQSLPSKTKKRDVVTELEQKNKFDV